MHKRIAIYLATAIGLLVSYILLRGNTWQGSQQLHTTMETLATSLALIVGVLSLVRYYTRKNNLFLFMGTGFLGTAFLDGYHAVVTSAYFEPFMPSDNDSLIPWSWIASRAYLSLFMFFSYLAWRREDKLGVAGRISEHNVYLLSLAFTSASFLFFFLVPLPSAYYQEYIFYRPEDFIPALFFGLALAGYLHKGYWRYDNFEHWLVISLIIGFIGQAAFMTFSDVLFDFEFDAAHTLKKASYICVLVGLLYNMANVYAKAEQASQAKSNFLNIVSHEFRTPLTVVLGYTPVLKNARNLPSVKNLVATLEAKDLDRDEIGKNINTVLDDVADYAEKMSSSGRHLLKLINDMLDISKFETGNFKLDLQSVSIDTMVGTIVEQFTKAAADKNLKLHYETNGEVVIADELRLTQILINLVGNSIKFTDSGSITIRTRSSGAFVECLVSDTGCGISESAFSEVFERFNQADESATRKAGGTGMGLAIVKLLVELHGGQVDFTSKVGKGSTFCFTIPTDQEGIA
ncbi:MAG: hypothetical protein COA96_11935 [SAR86 cluster bacterium]|uniref:histidine kinase n=1 Tax=SAR86 cluster bacterium TaxID=2030880 RepID=A0A2A5AW71_9GAMM|nr:MAG: hypothetical protein COA96_11935 [SAR86 cluster bacterium]